MVYRRKAKYKRKKKYIKRKKIVKGIGDLLSYIGESYCQPVKR